MSWTRGLPRRAARPTYPPSDVSLWGAQPPTLPLSRAHRPPDRRGAELPTAPAVSCFRPAGPARCGSLGTPGWAAPCAPPPIRRHAGAAARRAPAALVRAPAGGRRAAPPSARDARSLRCSAGPPRAAPAPVRPGAWGRSPHHKKLSGRVGGERRAARAHPIRRSGRLHAVGGGISTLVETRQCGRPRCALDAVRALPHSGSAEGEPGSLPAGAWGRSPHGEENPRTGGWAEPPCEVALASTARPGALVRAAMPRRRRGSARSSGRPCRRSRGRSAGGAPAGSPRHRESGAPPP